MFRIVRLEIDHWRNLRDVVLDIPQESPLVCLVGENGTGKSAILELVSSCCHEFGLAQGVEISRGDPLNEPHRIKVVAQVADDFRLDLDLDDVLDGGSGAWDGQVSFTSELSDTSTKELRLLGVGEASAVAAAQRVKQQFTDRNETHHLHLDADRAYPPMPIEPHRYGEIWAQQWEDPKFTRGWAYRPSRTLYEEWMKFFIGVEERAATEHITAIRRARDQGESAPEFLDPFDGYREAIRQVLPHLRFVGVESAGQRRTPFFDSAGLELSFDKLSGGEREIAFLIGQIERFKLQRGLLLIDEPELHLNPDLLRAWLAFLRDSVADGQIWIATHSLEAVEVSGPSTTFVLERDVDSRLVHNPSPLVGRPVLSALSAAVGSPAFAISRLRFVYVEGDRQSRERERFHSICGEPDRNRFLEGGSCSEVLRRLSDVRVLAYETGEQLNVGGVIDRDFRSDDECDVLTKSGGVHVLGCHEVENVFLDPQSLAFVIGRSGRDPGSASQVVVDAADGNAGLWIAQYAAHSLPEEISLPKQALTELANLSFTDLESDWTARRDASAAYLNAGVDANAWTGALEQSYARYQAERLHAEWYRHCLGKQALSRTAVALGFQTHEALERFVIAAWADGSVPEPAEVVALRSYVQNLSP